MKNPANNMYFTLNEYKSRINRLKSEIAKYGLDAVMIINKHNSEYVSGFLHGTWMHGFGEGKQLILVTPDIKDEPVLIAPEGLPGCFDTTAISDIRISKDLGFGDNIKTAVKVLEEKGLLKARIGIENNKYERMGLTNPAYDMLLEMLPGIDWVDCTGLMYNIRKVKSPMEIEKVRKAVDITCKACEVGLNEIREGMSEKELANIITIEMYKLSKEPYINPPFIFVNSTGRSPVGWDGVPSNYRFRKHDLIYIDCGFNYHGYYADIIRIASIGEPSKEARHLYYAIREANMALIDYMKPGMKCCDLYDYLAEKKASLGYSRESDSQKKHGFIYEGHGIGLSIHEPPIINDTNSEIIEEGMTMSIEGNIFDRLPFSKTTLAIKNEENILVKKDGCEVLSKISNDIWISEK